MQAALPFKAWARGSQDYPNRPDVAEVAYPENSSLRKNESAFPGAKIIYLYFNAMDDESIRDATIRDYRAKRPQGRCCESCKYYNSFYVQISDPRQRIMRPEGEGRCCRKRVIGKHVKGANVCEHYSPQ